MYESFFGLKRRPFAPLPDPALFYPSPGHRQAMRLVASPLHTAGGWLLLTGDAGVGKTALARYLIEQTKDRGIGYVHAGPRAGILLHAIGTAYGFPQPASADLASQRRTLAATFAELATQGYPPLLIIDGAQDLDHKELEGLLSLDPDDRLRLLLLGRSELGERLRQPGYEVIRARIVLFYQLNPLNPDETSRYIRYRLQQVGGSPDLFTPQAVASIFTHSRGLPRLINLLCEQALILAYQRGARSIDEQLIAQAMCDPPPLDLDPSGAPGAQPSPPDSGVRFDQQERLARTSERPLASASSLDLASFKPHPPDALPVFYLKSAAPESAAPEPSVEAPEHPAVQNGRLSPHYRRPFARPIPILIAGILVIAGLIGWYLYVGRIWIDATPQAVSLADTDRPLPESVLDTPASPEPSPLSSSAEMPLSETGAEQPGFEDLISLAQEPSGPTHQPLSAHRDTAATDDGEPKPNLAGIAERLTALGIAYEWRSPSHLRADLSPKIQFREGSVALDEPARAFLAQIAAVVREAGDIRLHVRAHTDSHGAQTNNQRLSQRRAADVAFVLRLNGIPNSRITYEGKGSSEPRFSPEEERRLGPEINRRIEIDLIAGTDGRY
ncbi:OmpA family protein [Caldichromatium japonicum]|uniref:OmpA family protein n=1 Tax=Caldichromatium japonicum TaxID=2699430 RepID=A0A6G7VEI2_9GAMM|nr:OmpA family protein [Caldichromatium japonicum]QIK38295.1 OmpA family protein [Caldichromatium japonicum]